MPQQPLGGNDCLGVVAAGLEQRGEALEGRAIALAKPLALAEEPLVVPAREQVARVQLDRFLERGELAIRVPLRPRDRRLEGRDVEPDGRIGPPLQHAWRDVEEPVDIRQRVSQVAEDVAEIGPRLGLGRLGPEEEREPLPRMRRVPAEEEVGEQRLDPRGLDRRGRGITVPEVEFAEEADAEGRCPLRPTRAGQGRSLGLPRRSSLEA